MRASLLRISTVAALAALVALPAAAQEGEHATGGTNLLEPHGGLMFWTLVIFIVLMFVLSRFAFRPMLAAVEAREHALEKAVEGARRDRDEAARLLEEQRKQLEAARTEAQRFLAEGRAAGEKMRADMMEQTQQQQQEMLERARRDIEAQKERAIADLRREAVDLALAGASRVIERNLDDQSNRRLVESFLASVPTSSAGDGTGGAGTTGGGARR
ncbi:MAG TPA: F0F1 ATP synthase subunit B [Gemmatimonadaceae bacterium]|nr:F0F1 ATP synthase subunit B [Gemmatimonadaceae bacterium]